MAPLGVQGAVGADPAAASKKSDQRLSFIQALRGIAASAVAIFHCYYATPVSDRIAPWIALSVDSTINLGFLGVDLFFLISGFVIALTLYGRLSTLGEYGRFFLRRQVRLDPPYWSAIAVSIVSALVVNHISPGLHAPVPGVGDVIAHILYLQGLLGIQPIAGIFWTLCLEIQFYLFFGAWVLIAARAHWSGATFGWIMLPLYAYSIACFWQLLPAPDGLFIVRWFEFFTGVMVFLLYRKAIGRLQLLAYLGVLLAVLVVDPATDNGIAEVTVVTVLILALVFWLGAEASGLKTWLAGRVWRYLGDISYSLYLTHAIVGIRLLKITVHPQDSPLKACLLYLFALAASAASADLLFRVIERPSMRLSARLKWRAA